MLTIAQATPAAWSRVMDSWKITGADQQCKPLNEKKMVGSAKGNRTLI
jgi:hypothetical protein